MIAILGGLGAALCWMATTLTSSRAGRRIGPASVCAWMMLIGVATAAPLAALTGPLPQLTTDLLPWLAGSTVGGVGGLLLSYRGYRLGKVGVVAALSSTEGAIAAVLSVLTGERLTLPVAAVLVLLTAGVAVVALGEGEVEGEVDPSVDAAERRRHEREGVICGAVAALLFGVSIFSTAQLGKSLSPFAAVLPIRLGGTLAVFIPMAVTGRLRLTRPAVPMVVLLGVGEVLGNAAYVVGAGVSIAVTAVLASQFAALTAIGAFVLFHERLTLQQRSGVIVISVGVAALTLVRWL